MGWLPGNTAAQPGNTGIPNLVEGFITFALVEVPVSTKILVNFGEVSFTCVSTPPIEEIKPLILTESALCSATGKVNTLALSTVVKLPLVCDHEERFSDFALTR